MATVSHPGQKYFHAVVSNRYKKWDRFITQPAQQECVQLEMEQYTTFRVGIDRLQLDDASSWNKIVRESVRQVFSRPDDRIA